MNTIYSLATLATIAAVFWMVSCDTALATVRPMQTADDSPEELGEVNWQRDLVAAQKIAAKTGRPIFLLFQEIPGCETCKNFGKDPLSHPLMVEAIEDLFVPVAIHNNKPGIDEKILKEFDEPAWNNPVVRFIDADKKDVVSRKDGVWEQTALAARMVAALKSAKQDVPTYLQQLAAREEPETATFAMHCYWEGEAKLGAIQGVTNTRSGWKDELEVVQVEFDPAIVDYEKLVASAQSFECASKIYAHNEAQQKIAKSAVGDQAILSDGKMRDAKQSDQTYYLRNSNLRHLPLSELQSTKINGVLYSKMTESQQRVSIQEILSPRQRQAYSIIERVLLKNPEALNDFVWPDNDSQLAAYANRLFKALHDKERVSLALVGFFDLDGDGKSDRKRMIDLVESSGGRVAAQHDSRGVIVGEIDSTTRYLVVGNIPDDQNDPAVAAAAKSLNEQADKFGVERIAVEKLLNWVGGAYKIERLDSTIGQEFRRRSPIVTNRK